MSEDEYSDELHNAMLDREEGNYKAECEMRIKRDEMVTAYLTGIGFPTTYEAWLKIQTPKNIFASTFPNNGSSYNEAYSIGKASVQQYKQTALQTYQTIEKNCMKTYEKEREGQLYYFYKKEGEEIIHEQIKKFCEKYNCKQA